MSNSSNIKMTKDADDIPKISDTSLHSSTTDDTETCFHDTTLRVLYCGKDAKNPPVFCSNIDAGLEDGSHFMIPNTADLPPIERYTAKSHDLERVYGRKDSKDIKLLKMHKRDDFTKFSKGSFGSAVDQQQKNLTEADLVSSGFQLLIENEKHDHAIKILTNLSDIIKTVRYSPKDISRLNELIELYREKEGEGRHEQESKTLMKLVKKILSERKYLNKTIRSLKTNIDNIKIELKLLPTKSNLYRLRFNIRKCREDFKDANNNYVKTLRRLRVLERQMCEEYEKYLYKGESLFFLIEKLLEDNDLLRNEANIFIRNAESAKCKLVLKMDDYQRQIDEISIFVQETKISLLNKCDSIGATNLVTAHQLKAVKLIKEHLERKKNGIEDFKTKFHDLEIKSSVISEYIKVILKNYQQLLRNFTFIIDNFPAYKSLELFKIKKMAEMDSISLLLREEKQNLYVNQQKITRLESILHRIRMKSKIQELDRSQYLVDKKFWDQKINNMFDLFERMEELREQIKVSEIEKLKERQEFIKQFGFVDEQGVKTQDGVEFSIRFGRNDETAIGLCTLAGEESKKKENLTRKIDVNEIKEFQDSRKSLLVCAHRNENTVSQETDKFNGTFAKFASTRTLNQPIKK